MTTINKQTQQEIVENMIKADGYISRNWCLQNYISCLNAIIYNIKKEKKWDLRGKYYCYTNSIGKKCRDYRYYWHKNPVQVSLL